VVISFDGLIGALLGAVVEDDSRLVGALLEVIDEVRVERAIPLDRVEKQLRELMTIATSPIGNRKIWKYLKTIGVTSFWENTIDCFRECMGN